MKNLAIYAGSFNPFHIGHLNIVEKGEKVFGHGNVLVAIGINPSKTQISDLVDVNGKLKSETLSIKISRPVEFYNCFLHEFIELKEKEGYNVILIRGLRNGDDLSYENNQLRFMQEFKPDVKSVFIMCDKEFEHISSSAIRQLESFSQGSGKKYLL
jgi:pantetheine-phosphate adenylyltransferase